MMATESLPPGLLVDYTIVLLHIESNPIAVAHPGQPSALMDNCLGGHVAVLTSAAEARAARPAASYSS